MNSFFPEINITGDASGAVQGALKGDIVVIIDVIDMSTTLETALDEEALAVLGASPAVNKAPVKVNPAMICRAALKIAVENKTEIVIATEPRYGTYEEKVNNSCHIIEKLTRKQGLNYRIIPNAGKEISKFVLPRNKVFIAVTDSGGTAFDAAYNIAQNKVITATVARTKLSKGDLPAEKGALRALKLSTNYNSNITVVAASTNSYEDILAAQFIKKKILNYKK